LQVTSLQTGVGEVGAWCC